MYSALFPELKMLNWEHLERKRAFFTGKDITYEEETTAKPRLFWDLPDIYPIKVKTTLPLNLNWNFMSLRNRSIFLSAFESI